MIKQQSTTQERPVFGVDPTPKKKRQAKVEKPVPQTPCAFQILDIIGCNGRSKPCQNEALANGWCEQHQHAQDGMDEGERLGYRSVEIPVVTYHDGREPSMIIIGQGKRQWEAYFERARNPGLTKVLDYLSKQ
jgi:hypothetical protein